MNFQFYVEKLFDSQEFGNFKSENSKAYFCGGFFSIDKEGADNKAHLDFFEPGTKKFFSFHLEKGVSLVPVESAEAQIPEKIPDNLEFNFDWIEHIIEGEMAVNSIDSKIQKIILSLQRLEGKDYLLGTVFISNLGMLRVKIDLEEKVVSEFEKKSFMDMVNVFKK